MKFFTTLLISITFTVAHSALADDGYGITPYREAQLSEQKTHVVDRARCHELDENIKNAEEAGKSYGTWDEIPNWKAEKVKLNCSTAQQTAEKQN